MCDFSVYRSSQLLNFIKLALELLTLSREVKPYQRYHNHGPTKYCSWFRWTRWRQLQDFQASLIHCSSSAFSHCQNRSV